MREEIQRISQLVAEGKLSAEDGAELIEAFVKSDREARQQKEAPAEPSAPPPPPPQAPKDPFRSIFESVEKNVKQIDWKEIGGTFEQGAKRGIDAIRGTIDDISKGKFVGVPIMGNQENREISLPLSIPEGKRLKIDNPCGDVTVIGRAESSTLLADATFRAGTAEEARNRARDYTVIVEESDSVVLIRQPDVSGLRVDLTIRLTTAVAVEIRTEMGDVEILENPAAAKAFTRSGDVKVRGAEGPVEVSADSGDVELEHVESPSITLETKSGDLSLRKVRGNVNARTAAGEIDLVESYGKVIALESVSGDVNVDLVEPVVGSLSVRTVNGGVIVDVPDGSDCRVSLSSLRGEVAARLSLQDEAKSEGRTTGRIGEGVGTLDVSAVTGDVELRLRSTAAV